MLANIRWEVAAALPKIGAEHALPELIKALGDGPPAGSTRTELIQRYQIILECVAAFGPSARPAVSFVVPYLGLYLSEKALAGMGLSAIPTILKHLENRDVRKDAWVFDEAAKAISAQGESAGELLLDAYVNGTIETREVILKLSRYLKPPVLSMKFVPIMCKILTHGCHAAGCHHMGTCMTVPAQDILLKFGPEATAMVCECFDIRDHKIRQRVFDITDKYGRAALPMLAQVVESTDNVRIKAHACAAILRTDPENSTALDILASLLIDQSAEARLAAVSAATEVRNRSGFPTAQVIKDRLFPLLRRAWTDPDRDVRQWSTAALGRLNVEPEPSNNLPSADIVICDYTQLPVPESPADSLPPMPSEGFIRETLERLLPNGMVVRRKGRQVTNERGEIEMHVDEEHAPIQFNAQHLTQWLSPHHPGQPRFFKHHIMLLISAGWEFRGTGGPHVASYGLFAYDGEHMTHINGSDAATAVGDVLRVEAQPLDQIDPVELAWLFCHTLVQGAWCQHIVVTSVGESTVTKPTLTRTEDGGWKVVFWTLERGVGCFVTIPTLHRHTVFVSPSYQITHLQD